MNCAVYIVTNVAKTLYIGVTSHLEQRMYQHKMVCLKDSRKSMDYASWSTLNKQTIYALPLNAKSN